MGIERPYVGAYLFDTELARVDEVQDRPEPRKASVLDPLGSREVLGPRDADAVDKEEEEDRRDRHLHRLE